MNIGLVNEYYPPFAPGGAEWSTQALARALVDAGHTVAIITPDYGQQAAGVADEDDIRVARFAFPIKLSPGQRSVPLRVHANPAFYLYNAMRIAQTARTYHLNVLHAQGTYSLPGTLLAGRWTGARSFFTVRDTTTICPLTVCLLTHDFVPDDCGTERYRRECLPEFQRRYMSQATGLRAAWRKLSFEAQWRDARLRRRCLSLLDGVVAVSHGILDVYLRASLVRPDHTRVIYNIPPTGRTAKERVAKWKERLDLNQRRVVLYAGKFSPGKGTQDLVKASQAVIKRIPRAIFIFAGKGELGTSAPHIVNLGSIPHDDILALYELADLVAVPSVWPEPLSRVILEAMADGKPVVATRTGGSPEIVAENVTGLLVPKRNPEALADAIISLLADDHRRELMGRAALERITTVFDPSNSLEQLIRLYEGGATP